MRKRMPDFRESVTQKFSILSLDGRHSLYITVGFREDNKTPGEIKIVLSRTGSGARAYIDALSYAISIGMQHGAPLEDFIKQFAWSKFMPCGPVKGYDPIPFCHSPLDLAFRWLGIEFCGMKDLGHMSEEKVEEKSGL